MDYNEGILESQNQDGEEFAEMFFEICINIPSIYIMLERYTEALETIGKVEGICKKNDK